MGSGSGGGGGGGVVYFASILVTWTRLYLID